MGNNYTVTMPNEALNTLTWKELHAAKFTFDSPFALQLTGQQTFFAEKVVRLIPKRRMVVFGVWQGKSVVAKLFFDARHAKRHMEKDVGGVKMLQDSKIPTPTLYYEGYSADKRIYVLIFERIHHAKNLEEVWQEKTSVEALWPLLQAVVIELATQHVFGVLQHDLHMKNFLITEKTIYTLDGAQVELFPTLLQKRQSMDSLALFLSQLGVGMEVYQERLFLHYAKSRGWLLKSDDIVELFFLIKKWNEERWRRFEKKIFRECSSFACLRSLNTFGMIDRRYAHEEFMQFMHHPESAFTHPHAKVLKAGRSTTVIKVTLDQREWVVKRYNLKNSWHRLRRLLRTTRAAKSWRLAQKLNLFGIKTATPAAFLEKRYLGLRGKSYYVTEYVSGEHVGDFFNAYEGETHRTAGMITRVSALLKRMAKLDVTHGDLKMTNILINNEEQPVFIDLDGAAEHASLSSLRSAWQKEIKRFLKNFQDKPELCDKFKIELGIKN